MTSLPDSPYPSICNTCDLTTAVTCFNEQDLVIETIDHLLASLQGFDFTWEIIVIDDASTDGSVAAIQRYAETHPEVPLRLYVNNVNQGFGSSIVEGAFLGLGTWYRVCPADASEPKQTFDAIFQQLGKADIVIPWIQGDGGRTIFRRYLSAAYTLLINVISGYRLRYYNGLYLARRTDFMRYSGNYKGFGAQADLLCRMLDQGRSYVEVPKICVERKHGASQALKPKNILSVALTVFDMAVTRLGRWLYPRNSGTCLVPHTLTTSTPAAKRSLQRTSHDASSVPALIAETHRR